MGAVTTTVAMEIVQCYKCGIVFGIPGDRYKILLQKRNLDSFYCPNGHEQHYVGESDRHRAARLEREIVAANNAKQFAERQLAYELEHQRKEQRKELNRIARRAKAGVCPCCKRTVIQMARHMATKHPFYNL